MEKKRRSQSIDTIYLKQAVPLRKPPIPGRVYDLDIAGAWGLDSIRFGCLHTLVATRMRDQRHTTGSMLLEEVKARVFLVSV